MAAGFLKLSVDAKVDDLIEANPCAFVLATQIARRARRTNGGLNRHGLEIGEALVGDFRKIGMSRRQYRTAVEQLTKWQIATFKTTNKGTIARLTDTSIYDINAESDGQQAASRRPAGGQQAATNEEGKEGKNGKNPPSGGEGGGGESRIPQAELAIRLSKLFRKKSSTEWSVKDIAKYRELGKARLLTDENLTLLERYYEFERAKPDEKGVHRRSLSTFLNNFTGELDRAREWDVSRKNGHRPTRPSTPNPNLVGMREVTA